MFFDSVTTVDEIEVRAKSLTEMARTGFSGFTLGDLVALVNDLIPIIVDYAPDTDRHETVVTLLENTCQALSNAVVLGGKTNSTVSLNLLRDSLRKFNDALACLDNIDDHDGTIRRLSREFKAHAEHRLELVESFLETAMDMREPLSTEDDVTGEASLPLKRKG